MIILKMEFSGGILSIVGFPARGLLEMCLIHFKGNLDIRALKK